MTTHKRRVEVFTSGCPLCATTVSLVKSLACPTCEVQVYDLREGCATNECRDKAARYGMTAVPAVAVDDRLLDCCRRGPIDAAALQAAGIGRP
ncbi:glutaredoxin [Nitrospira moscoviensis]|uniref:glutaredoxin n=1 Tax=Nitrospira moscoviensis TaxID=42253 RepID=UPI0009F8A82D|nr:glutaredoxin [Nitrospira moscoviensis]